MKAPLALLIAGAALLAACQTGAPIRTAADYVCQRSGPLTVAYMNDVAMVQVGGERYRLPQMRSASGTRYGDGRHEWRAKGSTGLWITGRMAPDRCEVARQPR